jgi:multicomponent Na+:H+ antiporter subunit G
VSEIIGLIFVVVGIAFDFFGCLGLIRFPDIYNRLHSSIKCVTLGTSGILLGLFCYKGFSPSGVKALLCVAFLFLTSPVSAHALSRAAHISGVKLWEKSVCDEYEKDKCSSEG